jgi:hypothetical protein
MYFTIVSKEDDYQENKTNKVVSLTLKFCSPSSCEKHIKMFPRLEGELTLK